MWHGDNTAHCHDAKAEERQQGWVSGRAGMRACVEVIHADAGVNPVQSESMRVWCLEVVVATHPIPGG